MHFYFPAFFVFWKGKVMLVRYKRNKQTACYDSNNLVTVDKIPSAERPRGPFQSCGSCPYLSHGFFCYSSEGDCLKTDIRLRDTLLRINGKFLLSYNDFEFIRSLYEAPGIQTEA